MAVLRLRSGLLKRFSSEKPNTSIETEDIASGDTIHPRRSKRLRDPTSSEPKNTAKVEDSTHLRLRKRRPDPTIKQPFRKSKREPVKENAAVPVLEPNAHTEKNDSLQKKEICPNGGDTSLQDQVNQLGTHDTAFDNANFTEDCHNVQPEVIKLQAEICKLKEQVDLLEEEVKTVIRAYENYRKRVRALGHEY